MKEYIFISYFKKIFHMCRLLTFIILALFFNSCAVYNTVSFEVLSPSEITVPTDVKTIAFVYRNTWTQADTSYLNKNKIENQEIEAFYELIKICYEGFSEVIVPTEKYDSVYFYMMDQEIIDDRQNIPLLNWDTVNNICSRLGADILVVLENGKFIISKEYLGDFENPDIHNNISWNFELRCYDPLYSKILDRKIYKDSVDLSNMISYGEFDDPVGFELERLSYSIGELYAMRINPYWKEVSRKIYNTGNKVLSAGMFYFNNEKYDTAISVWNKLIDNKNPKLAARACVNIASANEMLGNIEEAKKYASLSLFYYGKYKAPENEIKYSNNLIVELQRRIIENKILEEQF